MLLNDLDSTLLLLESEYSRSIEKNDTNAQIRTLHKLTNLHLGQTNYEEALNYISLALPLCDDKSLLIQKAYFLEKLSDIYSKFGDFKSSERYILEAHEINRMNYLANKIKPSVFLSSYLNITEIKRKQQDMATALTYIDSCFRLADSTDLPNLNNLIRVKANVLTNLGSLDQALELLLPLDIYFDNLAKKDTAANIDLSNHILVASGIGRIYRTKGNNKLALQYFQKSLHLVHILNEKLDLQVFLYEEIAKIHASEGRYNDAYNYLFEAYEYNNNYMRMTSERNKGVFRIRDTYKEKLDAKEKELILQRLELSKKEKTLIRFKLLMFLLIACLLIVVVLYKYRSARIKYKNEQNLLKQEKNHVQEQLSYKNKELASYSLQLLERDELLDQFSDYLKNDANKVAKSLQSSRKQLLSNTWEEFEKRFIEVNEGFYEKLSTLHPDLSIGDLKYCALLKLNLRGKEIAKLLGVTEKSVHMARYRLRKKFLLETNDSLEEFLNKI